MKEKIKKTFETTVSLSDTTQIGLPFGKSYFKPTPKFWRIVGDALSGVGTLGAVLGIKNPTFAIISAVSGWLGKIITNSISQK
jgi:hypothetical protein